MHLFGRYADIVAAEYLYSISAAQIARGAVGTLKRGSGAGCIRRVEIPAGSACGSFRESAALAFGAKLSRIAADEANLAGRSRANSKGVAEAEDFADVEHEKRGSGWGNGNGKVRRFNAAGKQAGGSLSVSLGISSEADRGGCCLHGGEGRTGFGTHIPYSNSHCPNPSGESGTALAACGQVRSSFVAPPSPQLRRYQVTDPSREVAASI